jgi:hypothetical protein
MGRRRITRGTVAAALCAGLTLAGCSGARDTHEGRKIEAVVKRFALSHDRQACNLLTHRALVRIYGGLSDSPRVAKAHCLARSSKFTGQPVEVTFVQLKTPTQGHATARTLDGRRYYAVALSKRRGRWFIDSITPGPRPG